MSGAWSVYGLEKRLCKKFEGEICHKKYKGKQSKIPLNINIRITSIVFSNKKPKRIRRFKDHED
jgi:hypothetical protein